MAEPSNDCRLLQLSGYLRREVLACLLAGLQRSAVRLIHQRWLSPHFLYRWGQQMVTPPTKLQPGSELQTQRRRFLHCLAESAGLIRYQQETLSLTPAAWLWLQADPWQQLRTLWQAWGQLTPSLWQTYRKVKGCSSLTHPSVWITLPVC